MDQAAVNIEVNTAIWALLTYRCTWAGAAASQLAAVLLAFYLAELATLLCKVPRESTDKLFSHIVFL